MNRVNDHAAERQFVVTRRLLSLLYAVVDAARAQSFKGIVEGIVDGEPAFVVQTIGLGDDDAITDEQRAEIESDSAIITHLRSEIDSMLMLVDELVVSERNLSAIETYLPDSIHDATLELLASEAQFAEASKVYQRTLEHWQQLDALTGRVRVRCVRHLMSPVSEGGQGMAATPADRAASDHADYTEHKDKTLAAAIDKDEAEVERDIARARLRNAQLVLQVLSDDRYIQRSVMISGDLEGEIKHFTTLREQLVAARDARAQLQRIADALHDGDMPVVGAIVQHDLVSRSYVRLAGVIEEATSSLQS